MIKVIIFRFIVKLMPFFMWRKKDKPQNLSIENKKIDAGKIRIYTPEGDGPFPVMMYMHGGGWVVGSIDTMDVLCREICTKAGFVVVSVDYPLAPENPFPAAPDACMEAFSWILDNIETLNGNIDRVFVGGDSAGGNLATVTALQAREKYPDHIKGQVLLYPVTDHYSNETVSYQENLKTRSLNKGVMVWFWDTYLKGSILASAGPLNERTTPLASARLSGLPPALVLMADKDPLRDEGIAYANKMAEEGVEVQQSVYTDLEHGFVGYMGATDAHKKAMSEIIDWLNHHKH